MIIAKVVTLQAGYRAEQEEVEELGWNIDDEFEVESISVGGWRTDVTLKDGGYFNSGFFEFYENGEPLNVYDDERFQKYKFLKPKEED